jgi:hypothetical protein
MGPPWARRGVLPCPRAAPAVAAACELRFAPGRTRFGRCLNHNVEDAPLQSLGPSVPNRLRVAVSISHDPDGQCFAVSWVRLTMKQPHVSDGLDSQRHRSVSGSCAHLSGARDR